MVHVDRLKTSGTNRTRLVNNKLRLDTAYSVTDLPPDHSGPSINGLKSQEVHSYTIYDRNIETSTDRSNDSRLPICPSSNHGSKMTIRQTEIRRVVGKAAALIPSLSLFN